MTTARPQQRYDHRLRELVHRTGDLTIATDLGVPPSTSLKHQWLFLRPLDSVTTVRRLVEFYVDEHNRVLAHSAFRGQTPDEMYFGTGDTVPRSYSAFVVSQVNRAHPLNP